MTINPDRNAEVHTGCQILAGIKVDTVNPLRDLLHRSPCCVVVLDGISLDRRLCLLVVVDHAAVLLLILILPFFFALTNGSTLPFFGGSHPTCFAASVTRMMSLAMMLFCSLRSS